MEWLSFFFTQLLRKNSFGGMLNKEILRGEPMNLLLHTCCAPCANAPIEMLRKEGIEVVAYWNNPNIHPFTEYRFRRDALRDYAKSVDLKLVEEGGYALRPFIRAVSEDIANRCETCYAMRPDGEAKYAAENGFDAFTSSLFISPYQNHELMREVASRAGTTYGVRFYDQDFRPLFAQGQEKAREMQCYMQKYCGCIFSEEDRYVKAKNIIP